MIVFVWFVFCLLLSLMGYAVYKALKNKEELQLHSYIRMEDTWIWSAVAMTGADLITFLRERKDLKFNKHGDFYEVNCVDPRHPLADSVVFPQNLENLHDVELPLEVLEDTARALGIRPHEALRFLAKKRSGTLLE